MIVWGKNVRFQLLSLSTLKEFGALKIAEDLANAALIATLETRNSSEFLLCLGNFLRAVLQNSMVASDGMMSTVTKVPFCLDFYCDCEKVAENK